MNIPDLEALSAAGIDLSVGWGGGCLPSYSFDLKPAEVAEWMASPEAFVARRVGVSVAELQGWFQSDGQVQCIARTRCGRRCRNRSRPGGIDHPAEWGRIERCGWLCAVHG